VAYLGGLVCARLGIGERALPVSSGGLELFGELALARPQALAALRLLGGRGRTWE